MAKFVEMDERMKFKEQIEEKKFFILYQDMRQF
jgi:hypothetical protein